MMKISDHIFIYIGFIFLILYLAFISGENNRAANERFAVLQQELNAVKQLAPIECLKCHGERSCLYCHKTMPGPRRRNQ